LTVVLVVPVFFSVTLFAPEKLLFRLY